MRSPYSLLNLLRERAEGHPDKRSYVFLAGGEEAEVLTFAQLNQRAKTIGARLQRDLRQGDRALLLYPPGTDYISAFYGCVAAGVVGVPAYPPSMNRNQARLESIAEDARPRVVLTTTNAYPQVRRWLDQWSGGSAVECVCTDTISAGEAAAWRDPGATEDTLCFLQYTSASTAKPKGVMVTHGNVLHNQAFQKEAVQHDRDTVMVSWLPLFHDMGLISFVLSSLYNGVPCYLMSSVDFLKRPQLWLEAISRYRGTFSGAPDFGYQLCVDKIRPEERCAFDLTDWRVAFNGSEPVRADTLERFRTAFASSGFRPNGMFPCYGLAEYTLLATGRFYAESQSFSRTALEQNHAVPDRGAGCSQLVSCGKPGADTRLVIADPKTCSRCVDGTIGESGYALHSRLPHILWLAGPPAA